MRVWNLGTHEGSSERECAVRSNQNDETQLKEARL